MAEYQALPVAGYTPQSDDKVAIVNINKELEEFKNNPKDVKVMFSAHGVPESYVAAGDPYKGQIEKCAELIMKEVNKNRGNNDIDWTLCFQSRVGPVKWLEPYTDDVLQV